MNRFFSLLVFVITVNFSFAAESKVTPKRKISSSSDNPKLASDLNEMLTPESRIGALRFPKVLKKWECFGVKLYLEAGAPGQDMEMVSDVAFEYAFSKKAALDRLIQKHGRDEIKYYCTSVDYEAVN